MMKAGIIGYGSYIPKKRVTVEEIAKLRNHDVKKIKKSLLVEKKAVASHDEDAATIAVAAAQSALCEIDPKKINAIYVGSESHPYAVKPTATIVAAALDINETCMASDVEFACKGGTAALQICYGLVKSELAKNALAIGSDVAQAAPGDILEYTSAAGGAAFVVGTQEEKLIATIDSTISITTDTPDFWRRNLQKYPEHTSRFTGEPSYFYHTMRATKKILEKTNMKPSDFSHVIFHQPNGKFPRVVAKRLGFSDKQISVGLRVSTIGNSYSASSLLGLTKVFDHAQPGEKILLVSYGSGSGSDAFIFTMMQKNANENRARGRF
jgi:hydroxymethylglutaryl-CoA synthase